MNKEPLVIYWAPMESAEAIDYGSWNMLYPDPKLLMHELMEKRNKENIEMLIVGNSHAAYGIDANELNFEAHNIAQVSQSIYFDKRITLSIIIIRSSLYQQLLYALL